MMNLIRLLSAPLLLIGIWVMAGGNTAAGRSETVIWEVNNLDNISGYKPLVLGAPVKIADKESGSLFFDGVDDGLIIPSLPIEGWDKFTIEVLLKPAADGPSDPRFIHFEDEALNRGTMELRITPEGEWYLDAFLKNGRINKGLTLIDSTLLQPCNDWYWTALVYDGTKMQSYVNGIKQLEGEVLMPVFSGGRLSVGVRLNKVNWYKGLIKEIRFHPSAMKEAELQRVLE